MIDFHVDRAGSVPAYAQLVRQVREALRMGLLQPGDQLPTVRSVVTSCTVNPTTVLKAYRELEMSGLVESRQGAGTFVSGTLGRPIRTSWPGCEAAWPAGWIRPARRGSRTRTSRRSWPR